MQAYEAAADGRNDYIRDVWGTGLCHTGVPGRTGALQQHLLLLLLQQHTSSWQWQQLVAM
jgi:hypothetical protein